MGKEGKNSKIGSKGPPLLVSPGLVTPFSMYYRDTIDDLSEQIWKKIDFCLFLSVKRAKKRLRNFDTTFSKKISNFFFFNFTSFGPKGL